MTWFPIAFLPPQLVDTSGDPYSGAVLKAYKSGTTTVITMATGSDGVTTATSFALNASGYPVSSGGSVIIPHVQEDYKLALYPNQAAADSNSGAVWTYDNITIADTTGSAFIQSFSGDGTTTSFTLSEDLGTDEKLLMVFADMLRNYVTNGTFATDTDWTKGAGWTIASGVATAASASADLEQTLGIQIVENEQYTVTYTISNYSTGNVTVKIGGTSGTARSADGTFTETIVAGSTQLIEFTPASSFTGDIDDVIVNTINTSKREVLRDDEFTVTNTNITFDLAPGKGTDNIIVFAPAQLLGQAAASAAAAASSETNAANAVKTFLKYTFSTTTTMADPGTGILRYNNATPASVTVIAIDDQTAQEGNPDISNWIITWDDASNTPRGTLRITKATDISVFAIYSVTGLTDNSGWTELAVTHVAGNGTFSDTDDIFIEFYRTGNAGSGLAAVVDDTTPQLGGFLDPDDHYIGRGKGGNIASASPLVIGADGDHFDVTGTTDFAAMTVAANRNFTLRFNDVLTITHGSGITIPGGGNFTTAAGDILHGQSTAANTVVVTGITKADGTPIAGSGGPQTAAHFAGATGTTTATTNITSVVRNSAGNYTVTFDTDFADANWYAAIEMVSAANVGARLSAKAAGSCTLITFNLSGTAVDPTSISFAAWGTLA